MPKQPEKPVDDARFDSTIESSSRTSLPDSGEPESSDSAPLAEQHRPKEYGGRNGPDPVRYGDWEKNGRCIDF